MVLEMENILLERKDILLEREDILQGKEDMVLKREDILLEREDMVLEREDILQEKEDILLEREEMVLPAGAVPFWYCRGKTLIFYCLLPRELFSSRVYTISFCCAELNSSVLSISSKVNHCHQ